MCLVTLIYVLGCSCWVTLLSNFWDVVWMVVDLSMGIVANMGRYCPYMA